MPVFHACFLSPSAPGLHPVPGGVFPVPPAAVVLMKLLPPPICFQVGSLYTLVLGSQELYGAGGGGGGGV